MLWNIGWRKTGAGFESLGTADQGQGDSQAGVIIVDQHAESKAFLSQGILSGERHATHLALPASII